MYLVVQFDRLGINNILDCPCGLNCLDGCLDCPNPICECEGKEDDPQWNRCIDANSLTLGRCIHHCDGDQSCENDCVNGFKMKQMDCPCEVSSLDPPEFSKKNIFRKIVLMDAHVKTLIVLR